MSLLRRAASIAAASTAIVLFAQAVAAFLLGGAVTAVGEWLGTHGG